MKLELNPLVDKYMIDGCMRCKYGATLECKVNTWRKELETLRQIVLESGLKEEIKWGIPVYTLHNKNIVSISAFKESANLSFFKGVLLKDEEKILTQQGNIQSGRIIKFTNVKEIEKLKDILSSYISEAITIEEKGKKVEMNKNPEPIPEELTAFFEKDPTFKKAFFNLTLGRQRGYIIYFSQSKNPQTRINRIEKYKQQIFEGIGFHDNYKSKK
ncbi:Uncharacterized conserved protein YdeI, YjbR/CyaY-like superfamily, DUF1801 family [Chishuiella changwenlii]|uniref:Uncharacterized conserved protein YdeI, YjbR/CyaY-like superfamily, DUF1801 family n=1 Tax=Chishuiella changwenlii TaxID=1434701 RepID=A0A1M6VTC3_9FLAO|nr:DUF1801 domain-containing protein [Chishuiella changwenlii]GGE89986.1 hypothetical protein GCM10010984_04580 [Chishuiella changwenlii]SHK84773.1 Uncharacterized conserved protein YdeI, YjbR/CyaY-like superfamily, DUF1801 family [Chishuiella changwenlii]